MQKVSSEMIAILAVGVSVLMLGWFVFSNLDEKIDTLSADIQRVESKVDQLTGYVRGLHALDLEEGSR